MFEFTEQDYKAFKVVAQQTQEQLSHTSQLVLEKYYEKNKIEICAKFLLTKMLAECIMGNSDSSARKRPARSNTFKDFRQS